MKRLLILSLLFFVLMLDTYAQGFAFGIKGGPSLGFQRGKGAQSSTLFSYHGIAYIESLPAGNAYAIFAQAGYNNRGSAQRVRLTSLTNPGVFQFRSKFTFTNLSLAAGAKQKIDWNGRRAYYMLGLRGEYTLNAQLDEFNRYNIPYDAFVEKLNYGLIIGGGLEFEFTDLVGGLLEVTLNPDLSPQYQQFSIPNVTDPITGNNVTIPERRFLNVTLEVSLGIRLLRLVEFID